MKRWLILLVLAVPLALPAAMPRQEDHSCNGQDVRCPDGKFHGADGKEQPDTCDNTHDNTHGCDCERTNTNCSSHSEADQDHPGYKCQTYCRPKACKCASPCDS